MTKAFKTIQGMNDTELSQKLLDLNQDNVKLRAQIAIGTVPKNALQLRMNKRMIARILTLKQQQALGKKSKEKPKAEAKAKPAAPAKASAPAQSKETKAKPTKGGAQ